MKTGRPKLPKGKVKSHQVGLRFNDSDYKSATLLAKKEGFKQGEFPDWARFVLMDYVRSRTTPPTGSFKVLIINHKTRDDFVGFPTERIRYIACKCKAGS